MNFGDTFGNWEFSQCPFVISLCLVVLLCSIAAVLLSTQNWYFAPLLLLLSYDRCWRHYSVAGLYIVHWDVTLQSRLRHAGRYWDMLYGVLFKTGTGLCKFIELNMHFTYLWVQNGSQVPIIWSLFYYQDEIKQLGVESISCVEIVPTIQIRGLYLLLLYCVCEFGQPPWYSRSSYLHVLPEQHDKKQLV